jgi:DNA end-binding protein Ku
MRRTGKCALAKYAARGKQYLVMIRPFQEGLLMQQLHYADEIKDFGEVPLGEEAELKEGELDLAIQLIEQIVNEHFEPEQYEDEVRARLEAAIQQKVEGKEVTFEEEAPKAQIIDLMEALKASLDSGGARKGPARSGAKKTGRSKSKKASSG